MTALREFSSRTPVARDPGSFRDPSGSVITRDSRVYRYLLGKSAETTRDLLDEPWFKALVGAGSVVDSQPLARLAAPDLYEIDPRVSLVVEHPRIEFLSYAYEWPFEMLRSAAMLQLELTQEAFAHGYILKDATPFNIQFEGSRGIFIDIPSFERYPNGEGWRAYSQFCQMFLYPLFLSAYAGLPVHTWLRSSMDGIDADTARSILPLRCKFRPSVFLDVVLQSFLNHRFAGSEDAAKSIAERKIPDEVVRGLLRRTAKTISGMKRKRSKNSAWLDYAATKSHYTSEADAYKEDIVRNTLEEARPHRVLDLGCNTGQFSILASAFADQVVAIDGDEASVDALYLRARTNHQNILPLVMDLLNPSPSQGWAQRERPGLSDRGRADWGLCLALVHHLAISGNVPLPNLIEWLASLMQNAIVEFVPRRDPMVQRLLATRRDVYAEYTQEHFERALLQHFTIRARATIPDTARVIYTLAGR